MTTTHHLKSWTQFFEPICRGERTHELRRDDRGFAVGDLLVLHEYDPTTVAYTGRRCTAEVTSITSSDTPCAVSDLGLTPGFCILSVAVVAAGANSATAAEVGAAVPTQP